MSSKKIQELKTDTQTIVRLRYEETWPVDECRKNLRELATRYERITGRKPSEDLKNKCSSACWLRLLASNEN